MNKAIIEMHGPVIIWLCHNPGKGIWRNNTEGGGWKIQYDPNFWLNYKYVQDDKYAALRMAQADGKVIQYNPCGGMPDAWEDMRAIDWFNRDVRYYRIKPNYSRKDYLNKFFVDTKDNKIYKVVSICPDENELAICVVDDIYKRLRPLTSKDLNIKPDKPKFKVGDWVCFNTREEFIQQVTSVRTDGVITITNQVGLRDLYYEDLKPWKPKEGEIICHKTLEGFYVVKPYSPHMKHFEGLAPKVFVQTLENRNE